MPTPKFQNLVTRLKIKIKQSQTPVPGFIIGLSGTDSLTAFYALLTAVRELEAEGFRRVPIRALHYINAGRATPSWFEAAAATWIKEVAGDEVVLEVVVPLGDNHDQQRWADIHLRALNAVESHEGMLISKPIPFEPGSNFWVVGCTNLTEFTLGKFSLLSDSVSIQPIRSLWKSEIMVICERLNVPKPVMEAARMGDCFCGREELAAENIELIDAILRNDFDPAAHDSDLLKKLIDYVRETKRAFDFRQRVPYIV
ncbi:NAD synthetase [Caulobacter phage CcrPW]|uniref:NAD/GMP synthase domain-containing protein n=1 Tax=Caulobacter phage CcrPW TaxID=2283271 RepID=A0A385EDV0_9CAUD|nr:NAD synthetase [Caulobacter phage CcrPW]AXQ68918.1 hypothetical protein CcrPW_gp379c [Caulobacter phage CcrPW]